MRAYQQVLARIEQDLTDGLIDVGGRLPAERALAERSGVSRASVREAIKVLEAMGVIRTAVGSGPDAGAVVIADPAAPIGSALRWHLASRHLPVADLVQARLLVETWAAREAAVLPGANLQSARDLLQRMESLELSATEFLDLDAQFHLAVTSAAGNDVVSTMLAAMRESIRAYTTAAVDRLADWPAMAAMLRAEHRAVVACITAGDAAGAELAIRAHITGFYTAAGVG